MSGRSSATLTGRYAPKKRPEPKIDNAHLQLFLNACKLLDLALILPADSLPQFQLHRWAFLGDSTSPTSFDITTIFTALSKADNALPLDTISIFSFDDRSTNNNNNESLLQSLLNEANATVSSSTTTTFGGDTTSLHSNSVPDSSAQHGPQSLPATLSSNSLNTTASSGNSRPGTMKNYIPHIVIINSILNYLTVSFQS